MYGWRGKIGYIAPPQTCVYYSEFTAPLPKGVAMTVTTLGVDRFAPEDFQKVFEMYPAAAKGLAAQGCDIIHAGGALGFLVVGYERSQKMIEEMRRGIKTPIMTDFDAHFGALRALSAKKIVMVSPFEQVRNEERKRAFEAAGFKVIHMKGLGLKRNNEVENLPDYASYRLAKEACLEAPEADAIFIVCPTWETVHNIERLEFDTGKPVVSQVTGCVWAWLKALNIKESAKGYGRLFELL